MEYTQWQYVEIYWFVNFPKCCTLCKYLAVRISDIQLLTKQHVARMYRSKHIDDLIIKFGLRHNYVCMHIYI